MLKGSNQTWLAVGFDQSKIIHCPVIICERMLKLITCHLFQIKNMCQVEYRKFDFSKYPEHVSNLRTYAFKFLIANVSILKLFIIVFIFG